MSNRMETEELKTFLQLRGLKVTVKKEIFVEGHFVLQKTMLP